MTLTPRDEGDLAAILRDATAPLLVTGGDTRRVRPAGAQVLSTAALSGVRTYEPGALTLVAGAGTPMAEIAALLAAERQILPWEPPDLRALLGRSGESTLGGVIAANASGPRRVQTGAARDHVLGVRFVDGTGMAVRNGGRVMKNVTGYDLGRLIAGSHGRLAVLTEVAVKLLPAPETEATLILQVADDEAARAAMALAVTGPFDVSGAAALPDRRVILRLDGFAPSVDYRIARLTDRLRGHEVAAARDGDSAALWQEVRDATPLAGCALVWRVSMRPQAMAAGLLPRLRARADVRVLTDWAGGLCWVGLDGTDDPAAFHRALQADVADPALPGGGGGHATLVKAPEDLRSSVPVFQPEAPGVAALTRSLRARFDPRGILDPGGLD